MTMTIKIDVKGVGVKSMHVVLFLLFAVKLPTLAHAFRFARISFTFTFFQVCFVLKSRRMPKQKSLRLRVGDTLYGSQIVSKKCLLV